MVRKTSRKGRSTNNNRRTTGTGTSSSTAAGSPSWTRAATASVNNRFLERYFNTPVYVRMVNQISLLCVLSKIQSINIDPVYGIQLNSGAMGDIDLDAIREKAFNKHFKGNSINYKNLIRERVICFILNTDCGSYQVTEYKRSSSNSSQRHSSRLDDDDTVPESETEAVETTGTINDADVD